VPAPPEQPNAFSHADRVTASALRELPEALILLFDRDLRFVVAAGQALDRQHPDAFEAGRLVPEALPDEVWKLAEPLFRSALQGETRSREIWTTEDRHCLMVDVGPMPSGGPPEAPGKAAAGEQREIAGGVAVLLDITARRRADLIARPPQGGFEEVFERSPIGTGLLDRDGRWLLVNRALCEITGYTSDELVGRRFDGIVHPDDVYNDREQRQQLLAGQIPAFQVEKRYFDAAGETVAGILSMSLVRGHDGIPLHYIAQLQDISDRRDLEEHQRNLADHDRVTGLRNRRLFEQDLRLQVSRAQRYGEAAGLLVVSLDDFSALVARGGEQLGDELVSVVGRAIARRLRRSDLVARLGADEFAVLLPHADEDGMAVVVEGLSRVIPACTVELGDEVLHPGAAIGSTIVDQHTESAEQALIDAARAVADARRQPPSAT
jgi:diguanylate cyclase (GGDEF)-like protein/PAS domain S-box-containing protein